jgi:hypothetical protein
MAEIELFVSHSSKDKKIAQAFVQFLRAGAAVTRKQIRCTSDPVSGFKKGTIIAKALRKDIDDCYYFIPLITPRSLGSQWVLIEIGAAWGMDKEIIPVLFAKRKLMLPDVLNGILYCNITQLDELTQFAEELAQKIWYKRDIPSSEQIENAARVFLSDTKNLF